ncbi:MAG: LamG-like jellyroll fold domain-containing protein, partial [Phycisphaerae bacterium]
MRKIRSYLLFLLVGLGGLASAAVWTVSPWTDDASTGIDSSKTYTHALNMSYQTAPVVNGVQFVLCWGDFVNGGWDGNGAIDWDDGNNIAGDSYELSRDFRYLNSYIDLTGLTPGGVYELTFLSTGWEDGDRPVSLTDQYDTFIFNQDEYGLDNGIKIVGVYVADAAGELHLKLTGNFHIYAFANCEYTGEVPTVINPIYPDEFNGGNRFALDTDLEWAEEFAGSLPNPKFDVYMDPNSTKVEQLDPSTLVSEGQLEYSYSPAALANGSMYSWRIVAYADVSDVEPVATTKLRTFMTVYEVEPWSDSHWSDDSDSGISAGKLYTHKVNFNASEAATTVINGVPFENDTDRIGNGWTLENALGAATGTHQVGGDGGSLASSIYYGKDPLAVLTLTGLEPGTEYVMTQYTRGWGDTGGREVRLITSPDGLTTTLDGNLEGNEIGHLFKYRYTAPENGEMSITFDPVTEDSWHHYGFSNEVYLPVYADPTPLPGAQVNYDVELSWVVNGEVSNPSYNLRVATDPNMIDIAVNQTGLTETALTPYLNSDTNYFWQVDVLDGAEIVYTSPIWDFITKLPPDAEKVLEWKFDDPNGTDVVQTGTATGGDGTMKEFNAPESAYVAGLSGNALKLQGNGEYVDVSAASGFMPTGDGQSFAISGYMRTFANYGPLFSMRNSEDDNPIIDICLGDDGAQRRPGRICMLVRDESRIASLTYSSVAVNDGRWHNFIVTRTASKWTMYVDGEAVAALNGAATGAVDLNLLGIGASPRWIMDDHYLDTTILLNYGGLLDEFTVWNGQLQAHQIQELAAIVPPKGDIDSDLLTDTADLDLFAADWLADVTMPVQGDAVLEDMESYDPADPNSLDANWPYIPEDNFADLVTTIIDDPNGLYGQVMQMDYDFSTGGLHGHISTTVPNRGVDMGLYDNVVLRVKRLPGCDVVKVILDFLDGRGKEAPAVDELYNKGRITVDFPDVPVGEWADVVVPFPADDDLL